MNDQDLILGGFVVYSLGYDVGHHQGYTKGYKQAKLENERELVILRSENLVLKEELKKK